MKRMACAAALLAALLLVTGCTTETTPDFYPMTVGSVWCYDGLTTMTTDGTDTLSTSVSHTEVTGTATLTGGEDVSEFSHVETAYVHVPFETTEVYSEMSYARQSGDYILGYDDLGDSEPDTALALPLEQGKTWTVSASGDTTVVAEVVGREDVTVPAGTYADCWKVKMTLSVGGESQVIYWWYADGIGRVKNTLDYTSVGATFHAENTLTSSDIK